MILEDRIRLEIKEFIRNELDLYVINVDKDLMISQEELENAIFDFSKKESVKEYHQKGIYSEEEVRGILNKLMNLEVIKYNSEFCVDLWFDETKNN